MNVAMNVNIKLLINMYIFMKYLKFTVENCCFKSIVVQNKNSFNLFK